MPHEIYNIFKNEHLYSVVSMENNFEFSLINNTILQVILRFNNTTPTYIYKEIIKP